jgi:oligopeptide/dipeptide ABC transporter ATP-binding protein
MSLLELTDVAKHYAVGTKTLRAVDGVDLRIGRGEAVGLVGESGCGKSTVARLALRLIMPSGGRIAFDGTDISTAPEAAIRPLRRRMQLVQQNPHASLDPRRTVFASIGEPLVILGGLRGEALRARVEALAADVQLPTQFLWRYPHELSGGQKQRVCIARALALDPELIVLDEPTSALDVSVQAQILAMLEQLRRERGVAMLFISHNLAVVRQVCDRLAIMYLGRIVEEGPVAALFDAPLHPYSRALIDSILPPKVAPLPEQLLSGDPPSPSDLPPGCRFASRCPIADAACLNEDPRLRTVGNRRVACLKAPVS